MNEEVRQEAEEVLFHEGVLRKSGRYPWGSGENPYQRSKTFLSMVDDLQRKGLSDVEVAKGLGLRSTTELRAMKAIAKNEKLKSDQAMAMKLKAKGMSNVAVGERMGLNESSVRALLNAANQDRADILQTTANMLKDEVAEKKYLDIGVGTENHLGISGTKLATSVAMLKEEGYQVHTLKIEQQGTGKFTEMKVLVGPDVDFKELVANQDKIGTVAKYSEDSGRSYLGLETPRNVASSRVAVRYGPDGGSDKDGVIEIRRGVDDISLGGKQYAQVRVAIDGTHYLKGMAMYSDNLPPGVDMVFNTNKKSTGNKLDAMKAMKDDPDNPFGSVVRQRHYIDKDGKRQLSAMNIVNEEGDWYNWSKNLSSQMLSKQTPQLARQQLDLTFATKRAEYDEIMALTNPEVKRKLLQSFSDGVDASSVKLSAAGLPRTRQHVILPITNMKDNEVYAPFYKNGERVALIRHPHGGRFEIPELTVNNRHPGANAVMKNAKDAIGISPKVAQRLSGADFDGDTVLVIPNNRGLVKSQSPLAGLKDFDPQVEYKGYEGMPKMSPRTKQLKMGDVSNLITDMTIKGASSAELAMAVKHSMVVIDAEKHNLNWRQSAKDNRIGELKKKYQGGSRRGASTVISQASSDARINRVRLQRASENGGPIDRKTGKLVYVPDEKATYTNKQGQTVTRKMTMPKMATVDDAFKLTSGGRTGSQPMEVVYAEHANRLKALANDARKSMISVKSLPYNPSARKVYDSEVRSLQAKLNTALQNKPLERQAQLLARATVNAKKQANPDMDAADLKKIKGMALTEARLRTGAKKQQIEFTDREWEAVQAGAITANKLKDILDNAPIDKVKELATPRDRPVMVPARLAKAKAMANSGYTVSEIAEALGVPATTVNSALSEG